MRGYLKPLYLLIGRKGTTSLSPSSMHRTLRVDGCGHGRIGRNKSRIGHQPNPGRANCWRTNDIIYSSNPPSCKRSARRRTRNGRTQIPPSKTSLLHVHCPHSMQVTVPALPKDSVRSVHGVPEATTLLSRVFNNSSLRSTS